MNFENAKNKLKEYAQEHIDEIPVATNAEYIPYSDNFEIDDIDFEDNEQ